MESSLSGFLEAHTLQPGDLRTYASQCVICRGKWEDDGYYNRRGMQWSTMVFDTTPSDLRAAAKRNTGDPNIKCYCREVCFVFDNLPPEGGWDLQEDETVTIRVRSEPGGRRTYSISLVKEKINPLESLSAIGDIDLSKERRSSVYTVELCHDFTYVFRDSLPLSLTPAVMRCELRLPQLSFVQASLMTLSYVLKVPEESHRTLEAKKH